ncbi:terminal nucleotidyltransferase 4A-like [Neltuma alba]|uniref:terminal nucleotidyltransferase 4A-like n=1 Tax=Neltuma alba TaxID=207710 RepID=UPI0010A315D6|nr:terminal nucleotidyltransferase 4A-like [Prosopis alba]
MEDENFDTPKSVLYETLSPFYLSTPDQSAGPDELEPYTVFRNEISLSSLQCPSPETAAPDFFSLEVGNDDVSERESLSVQLPEPVAATEPKTPALVSEPKLESSWFRGNCKFRSPMLQLHKEIVDFCEFLSPTLEEKAARDVAIESVFQVIKHIWPHSQVEVFGSFRTGLYLPTSDIDVVILKAGLPSPQLGLNALSRALSQRGIAKNIMVIGKARVPIIKFVEKKSGVSFDVSFDVDNGPKAADYIQEAVARWPPLRPLCLILKVFLQQRELNEVYSGGIGSYALLAMLMAMLRNDRESHVSAEHNLGVLLVNFFDFYGRKLNTADVGVSCNGTGTFFLKSKKGFLNKGRPSLLAIEDPQAPENDIGKNSFNYFQVRSAFALAFKTLTNPNIVLSLGPNRSILGTIIRPDPVLVERKGGSNGDVTFNALLPGAGEPLQVHYGDHDMLCNWDFDDEEPLPRGGDSAGDKSTSGKKRKTPFKENPKKKLKENGHLGITRSGENVSGKENGIKKRSRRKQ